MAHRHLSTGGHRRALGNLIVEGASHTTAAEASWQRLYRVEATK